jgi:hypothetical protein
MKGYWAVEVFNGDRCTGYLAADGDVFLSPVGFATRDVARTVKANSPNTWVRANESLRIIKIFADSDKQDLMKSTG